MGFGNHGDGTRVDRGESSVLKLLFGFKDDGSVGGMFIGILISLVLLPAVIVGNVILFAVQPPLADALESHHTNTSLMLAMALKMTFFQVGRSSDLSIT